MVSVLIENLLPFLCLDIYQEYWIVRESHSLIVKQVINKYF